MPLEHLPNNTLAGSLGRIAGEGIGASVGSFVQGYSDAKQKNTSSKAKKKSLTDAFPDLPEGAVDYISNLEPKEQLEFLQMLGEQKRNQPQEQPFSLDQVTPEQKDQIRQYMANPESLKAHSQEEIEKLQRFLKPAEQQQQQQQQMPEQQQQQQQQQMPEQQQGGTIPGLNSLMQAGQSQEQPESSRGTIGAPSRNESVSPRTMSPETKPKSTGIDLSSLKSKEDRKAELSQKNELRKESIERQKEIDKETRPYYDKITNQASAAKENDMRLDRMETLIKKGDLTSAAWASVFKTVSKGVFGFGIDLDFLNSTDSQEFNKLSKDFLANLKDMFGSRILETEVDNYLKTIPTLSLTDDGKERVIRNMRLINKVKKLKKETSNELIKANGGRRPDNFDMLVDEITEPRIDAISEEFKNGMASIDQNTFWDKLKYVTLLSSRNPAKKR